MTKEKSREDALSSTLKSLSDKQERQKENGDAKEQKMLQEMQEEAVKHFDADEKKDVKKSSSDDRDDEIKKVRGGVVKAPGTSPRPIADQTKPMALFVGDVPVH